MPIEGLTTRERTPGAGFPCLGRIFKGEAKGEKRPGKDLKYFRIVLNPQFAYMEPILRKLYGDEPTEFRNILLLGDTPEQAFSTWKEEWSAGEIRKRCTGKEIVLWSDGARYHHDKKPCVLLGGGQCKCKNTGRLRMFLPDLMKAIIREMGAEFAVMGYFSITTTSVYDILTIDAALKDLYALRHTVSGIYMHFGRADKKVNGQDGKGNKISSTRSLLYLTISGSVVADMIPSLSREAIAAPVAALPSGEVEMADDPGHDAEPDDVPPDTIEFEEDEGSPFETADSGVAPVIREAITEFCSERLDQPPEAILEAAGMTWDDLSGDSFDKFIEAIIRTETLIPIEKVEIRKRDSFKEGQNPFMIYDFFLNHRLMEPRFDKWNEVEIDSAPWMNGPGVYELPAPCYYTLTRVPEIARQKNPDVVLMGKIIRV